MAVAIAFQPLSVAGSSFSSRAQTSPIWLLMTSQAASAAVTPLTESEGNTAHLTAPVILAISDIMLAHPEWPDTGLRWIEAFDRIDLGALSELARENRDAVPKRAALATLIYGRLRDVFELAGAT